MSRKPSRQATAASRSTESPYTALIGAGCLAACVAICYANALGNPFLFDDHSAIVDNTHIRQLWPLTQVLSTPSQTPLAGRPFAALTFALNYAFGGLSQQGYHAVNAAIVWATACLLYLLVRLTLRSSAAVPDDLRGSANSVALASAVLWTTHPLLSEVVDYSVQRTESLAGLLVVTTVYATARAAQPGRRAIWTMVAVVASVLGMATKESAVVAPLLALLYDVVFVTRSISDTVRSRFPLYGGLVASWLVLAALNIGGPRSMTAGFSTGVSPLAYLTHQGPVIAHYLRLVVWPHPLVVDYGVVVPLAMREALPALLLVGTLCVTTAISLSRWPAPGFLPATFFITLAPTSSLLPIASEVAAERRMYLPLMAAIVLAVVAAARWTATYGDAKRGRLLLGVGSAVLAVVFSAITIQRNAQFADQVTLWQGVVDARPHARAYVQLGAAYQSRGKDAEAIENYRRAAALGRYEAHYALAQEYESHGRQDEAIAEYQAFLTTAGVDYRVPMVHVMLGDALVKRGRSTEAEPLYRAVFAMQPHNAAAHRSLATLLFAAGRFNESVREYREYLQVVPTDAGAHTDTGRALVAAERPEEAAEEFATAVRLAPSSPGAHQNLALALGSLGRLKEAEQEFNAALKLAPRDATLYSGLAGLVAAQGRTAEARALAERALTLDPNNPIVRDDLRALRF